MIHPISATAARMSGTGPVKAFRVSAKIFLPPALLGAESLAVPHRNCNRLERPPVPRPRLYTVSRYVSCSNALICWENT